MIESVQRHCPWCGETLELVVDPSGGHRQCYVEDCWICCRPCVIEVEVDRDGEVAVEVTAE